MTSMTPTRLLLASLLGLLVTACASDNQGHPPSATPSAQTARGTSLAVLGDRYTITIPEGYEQLDHKTSAEATNTFFFNREQNKGLGFTEGGTPESADCGASGSDQASLDSLTQQILDTLKPRQQIIAP